MSLASSDQPPLEGAVLEPAQSADAAELLVLQRCCWVQEAIANETLDIGALHESLDDVRSWLMQWSTWCVRVEGRLVGAVRGRRDETTWEIGRLMVAPDLAGKGLGRWLLHYVERCVPEGIDTLSLFTGAGSVRNIAMYEAAGYRQRPDHGHAGVVQLAKPNPAARAPVGPSS